MKPIIFNAIDKLYNEKTGMIYPVSAAVGSKPTPTPTTVTSTVTYTETEASVWKMELAVTEGMSFSELTTQYPDWTGSVTSGEKVINFNADDITVDYITVTDLTIDSVPSDGDECTMVIMNDDVELYNSTTTAHVVEIPAPAEPLEVSNVVFHYDLEEDYKTNWSLTADIQINNIPEGWYGAFCFEDGEEQYTGNVFTATDLVDGTLTITDLMPNYDPISPVHVAILSNESAAYNYYYDSENPYVPVEGEIYAEVSASSTNVQNEL